MGFSCRNDAIIQAAEYCCRSLVLPHEPSSLFMITVSLGEMIMEKNSGFKCEECGSNELRLRKALAVSVELVKAKDGKYREGLYTYNPHVSYDNEYRCGGCGTVLMHWGNVVRTPADLEIYLSSPDHGPTSHQSDAE